MIHSKKKQDNFMQYYSYSSKRNNIINAVFWKLAKHKNNPARSKEYTGYLKLIASTASYEPTENDIYIIDYFFRHEVLESLYLDTI